jgi:hypothetical protein
VDIDIAVVFGVMVEPFAEFLEERNYSGDKHPPTIASRLSHVHFIYRLAARVMSVLVPLALRWGQSPPSDFWKFLTPTLRIVKRRHPATQPLSLEGLRTFRFFR